MVDNDYTEFSLCRETELEDRSSTVRSSDELVPAVLVNERELVFVAAVLINEIELVFYDFSNPPPILLLNGSEVKPLLISRAEHSRLCSSTVKPYVPTIFGATRVS